jgi:uncharacterized protein (TIGR02466 family)
MSKLIIPFGYPIYINQIDVNKKEFECVKKEKYVTMPNKTALYTENKKILNGKNYKSLKKKIFEELEIYTRDILKVKKHQRFYLTSSWINKHKENDFGQPHSHFNSIISGVYYFKAPKNSGNIIFNIESNKMPFAPTVRLDFEEHKIENSDEFFFEPIDGLITFFPSTLLHRIGINKQKELRYSLAFNFFVKGIFGTQEGELII